MRTITFNIKDKRDYKLLLQFAKRMGIDIVSNDKTERTENTLQLKKLLDSIKEGELFKEIKNPAQWQRDLKDEWK